MPHGSLGSSIEGSYCFGSILVAPDLSKLQYLLQDACKLGVRFLGVLSIRALYVGP